MFRRDPRYDYIKVMYAEGKIKSLTDIFKYVPKSVVAKNLGKKVDRFNALINKVGRFRLDEITLIGKFCELDESTIVDLTLKEYLIQKGRALDP